MKPTIRTFMGILVLVGALALCLSAGAQQTTPAGTHSLQGYDQRREVNLLGTVVKYDPASAVPPLGAHVLLQTSSGQVDVHLGNAKLLRASHLDLNPGDNLRIVGEPMALGEGAFFAARIVQKGTQAVAVRNTKGFLISPAATLTPAQKEALRGVR